ncbi:MAG: hypothetical protein N2249_03075 [Melioribacter sp.]|nr:hypothetical protein [Melioribacter sp.]
MSSSEQKKYFEILKKYEKKFNSKELEEYKMLLRRHKDDEDLDKLSMERLKELYIKYHVNRERKNYDYLFKKPDNDSNNQTS